MTTQHMFRNRTVLVSGSTSGIGAAIAERFASEGARVMINGFGEISVIEALLERLRALGAEKALHDGADMSRPETIYAMMKRCEEMLGGPDIVVNNAGVQHVASVEQFPDEAWERVISINLSAVFYMTKAALPGMIARDFGRIINVASAHGLVASPGKPAYVAAKHGVVGLTKAAALENAERNVTVNAVCPGWVDTPLVRAQIAKRAKESGLSEEEEAVKLVSEKHPNARFCTPASVAQAVLYFADPANMFCTGTTLSIDGGWTAR